MAAELDVSLIQSPLTAPIISGQVPVSGATIKAKAAPSVNTNSLEMLEYKYDVAEMSLATFTKARELGIALIALPIFPGRRFMQPGVQASKGANIKDPSDLRGKRVGLPQFWMTSSVWHRLILHQTYGVAQNEVSWVTTAKERLGSLGLPPEARMDTSGRSARDLLLAGEIDAVMGAGPRGEGGKADDRIVPVFPDLTKAEREYYEKSGVFPIAHLIVMKEELAIQNPELVGSLCNAFEQSKSIGMPGMLANTEERPIPGLSEAENKTLFDGDPWKYGIEPNRKVLELFLSDAREQGLVSRPMFVDRLFPSSLTSAFR